MDGCKMERALFVLYPPIDLNGQMSALKIDRRTRVKILGKRIFTHKTMYVCTEISNACQADHLKLAYTIELDLWCTQIHLSAAGALEGTSITIRSLNV